MHLYYAKFVSTNESRAWFVRTNPIEVPWRRRRRRRRKKKINVALCQRPTSSGPLEKWGRISPAVQWCYQNQSNCHLHRRTSSYGTVRLVLIAPLNCWRNSTQFWCKASLCTIKIENFRQYHMAQAYLTLVVLVYMIWRFFDGKKKHCVHLVKFCWFDLFCYLDLMRSLSTR